MSCYFVVVVIFLFRLKVVQVIGKRSRPVPILLTSDMTECMYELFKAREAGGILPDNKFFFALPGSFNGHLRFFNVLKLVATRSGMSRPDLLTTTRMRKHVATMAQVQNHCFKDSW